METSSGAWKLQWQVDQEKEYNHNNCNSNPLSPLYSPIPLPFTFSFRDFHHHTSNLPTPLEMYGE
jgi:hypothetical protein